MIKKHIFKILALIVLFIILAGLGQTIKNQQRGGIVDSDIKTLSSPQLQDIKISPKSSANLASTENVISQFDRPRYAYLGDRKMVVQIPQNGSWNKKTIIVLHGRTQDATTWFLGNSEQKKFADAAINQGFAVVAIDSISPLCPDVKQWDYRNGSDDVSLIKRTADIFKSNFGSEKIFVAGISSGGFMTGRLANTHPTSFDGIVIHSAGSPESAVQQTTGNCGVNFNSQTALNLAPNHPPTYILHGKIDQIVDYDIGAKLHSELVKAGIKTEMYSKTLGRHVWFGDKNTDILNWLKAL